MKYNTSHFITIFFTAFLGFLIPGCNQNQDFDKTANGLKYKIHQINAEAPMVHLYDIVEVYMNYRSADSVLFEGGTTKIPFQIEPVYDGDLMEGMMLMHKGDSATFVLNTQDFFLKMMQYEQIPEHAKDIDELYFDIKVVTLMPETPSIKAKREEINQRKESETNDIAAYLEKSGITIPPTSSGLYFIPLQEGAGKSVKKGDKVKVHYNASFLDGKKYDSSYDRGMPISFTIGNAEVISGWEEAVQLMKEGGKAKLIVPSKLGYGGSQRDKVKPYTPIIFEIELIKIEN